MSLIEKLPVEKLQALIADVDWSTFPIWRVLATTAGGYVAIQVVKFLNISIIGPALSPLRKLAGPPNSQGTILWGHLALIFAAPPNELHEQWFETYGSTITYRGILMSRRLATKDARAVSHILTHGYDFPKPDSLRQTLVRIFGNGVLFAEGDYDYSHYSPSPETDAINVSGDSHRRQRKVMNPCFGPAQIRDIMPIFYEKGVQLRDVWLQQVQETEGEKVIDVLPWLTRATLDVIGSAGFDYNFNSLRDGEKNELVRAFMDLFSPAQSRPILGFLAIRFPILGLIPTERGKMVKRSREVMNRIGNQLVQEKKAAVLAAGIDQKAVAGRDLLSVLVKSNMSADEKDRMSDDEVMGQISTMLIAGHETTSTSLTWLLYDLAKPDHIEIQDRLRAELMSVSSSQPTLDELNALPYLDAVIRENLRINSVVDSTIRCAGKDDLIPVSKPYVDSDGVERSEIKVAKGDQIFIPIIAMNRDKSIWGEDALEFKPERWLKSGGHPYITDLPGVFSNVLTFLGGPRHCIGYRLALAEMKVLLFEVIRNVSVSLPDGAKSLDVQRKSNIVTRPVMKQPDGKLKATMPLVVKAVGTS